MTNLLLTPELLRKLLRYEPDTGKLFWLPRQESMFPEGKNTAAQSCAAWNTRRANKEAFTAEREFGYKHGQVCGKMVRAHRAAWAIMTGKWPEGEIDHIDRNPSNNRWENLRVATSSQNNFNQATRKDSMSGVKGVRWKACKKKWQARIRKDGVEYHLGYFDEIQAAQLSYAKASAQMHGEFGRCS